MKPVDCPGLVIVDLNPPKRSGREILRSIRTRRQPAPLQAAPSGGIPQPRPVLSALIPDREDLSVRQVLFLALALSVATAVHADTVNYTYDDAARLTPVTA